MTKWTISDASRKRVEKRVEEAMRIQLKSYGTPGKITELLRVATAPEDYAYQPRAIKGFVETWIKDTDSRALRMAAVEYYREIHNELDELREAGRNLMRGIRTFGRWRL